MRALQIADGARDIAGIDVAQSGAPADLVGAQELFGRGIRVRRHLVILMERRDVPRNVGIDARQELGDLRQLLVRIVEAGNDERDDLDPDAALLETLDRIEHRLQSAAEVTVMGVRETFEIDFVEIDVGRDVIEHLLRSVSVGDVRADQAGLLRLLEDLHRPFRGDERLVVGRGDDLRAVLFGQADEIGGLDVDRRRAGDRVAQRLRGHPVLTVAAVVIAAEHPERERERAGIGVEERLLFDRIDLQRGRVSPRDAQHAVFVVADFADAVQAVEDFAAMAARIAPHRFVLEFVVQLRRALGRSRGQDLAERTLSLSRRGHGGENAAFAARIAAAAAVLTMAAADFHLYCLLLPQ